METAPVTDQPVDRLLARRPDGNIASKGTTQALEKSRGGETILFVEDEPTIREMAATYLQRDGYRVIEAGDGRQAVMLWEKHKGEIDLILADVMIPGGLNGDQLVERLQADRPDLKAILVSGYSSDVVGRETVPQETTSYLQKPYRLKNLSEMVQGCLAREEAAS
jgi:CheY-like chemotaxis protein